LSLDDDNIQRQGTTTRSNARQSVTSTYIVQRRYTMMTRDDDGWWRCTMGTMMHDNIRRRH